ncbi:hypothetical protein IWQ60_003531 [Tieghemiomyces parasiticus]|uniref:Uncharacterized protein n=1 Tax=Tieghemiomyces parasiticus TaxID=78921 RepID=A0A9W8DUQ7_9FUNG|nr:hypothetical protein IWQ60_003531 [Tieghemiomyces parasiticus]
MSKPCPKTGAKQGSEYLEIADERVPTLEEKLTLPRSPKPPTGLEALVDIKPQAPPQPRSLDELRKTFASDLGRPSSVLDRVQDFLPQLAVANKHLDERVAQDATSVSVEDVDSDEEQYVEMDLGLGTFERKSKTVSDDVEINTDRVLNPQGKRPGIDVLSVSDASTSSSRESSDED